MSFLNRTGGSIASVCDACGDQHPYVILRKDHGWKYWYHKRNDNFHLCQECLRVFPKVAAEFSSWETKELDHMHYPPGTETKS